MYFRPCIPLCESARNRLCLRRCELGPTTWSKEHVQRGVQSNDLRQALPLQDGQWFVCCFYFRPRQVPVSDTSSSPALAGSPPSGLTSCSEFRSRHENILGQSDTKRGLSRTTLDCCSSGIYVCRSQHTSSLCSQTYLMSSLQP